VDEYVDVFEGRRPGPAWLGSTFERSAWRSGSRRSMSLAPRPTCSRPRGAVALVRIHSYCARTCGVDAPWACNWYTSLHEAGARRSVVGRSNGVCSSTYYLCQWNYPLPRRGAFAHKHTALISLSRCRHDVLLVSTLSNAQTYQFDIRVSGVTAGGHYQVPFPSGSFMAPIRKTEGSTVGVFVWTTLDTNHGPVGRENAEALAKRATYRGVY